MENERQFIVKNEVGFNSLRINRKKGIIKNLGEKDEKFN